MVCTTLTIVGMPVVSVVAGTIGFTKSCVEIPGCSVNIADMSGQYVTPVCTIRVAVAKAKFNYKINYKKDGVPQAQYTSGTITQDVGDVNYCTSLGVLYAVGVYSDIIITIENVVPA